MGRRRKKKGGLIRRLVTLPVIAAGAWVFYSKIAINHDEVLPEALEARRVVYKAKTAARVNYYVDDQAGGIPLVLVHSVNAAASAYEMKPLFEFYRKQRTVYALELPGFGFSERPDRAYSPAYYIETIIDFLATQVAESADVLALSLSSEFVAGTALAMPDFFRSLSLISPTGLGGQLSEGAGGGRLDGRDSGFYSWLSQPLWAQALYDIIVSRPSLHYFLQRCFIGAIPPGMVDYAYAVSHQPGARYAPLHFISGRLFNPTVRRDIYRKLRVPVLVLYDRDAYSDFAELPDLLEENDQWRAERLAPSLGMPHFELTEKVVETLDDFWNPL